jgi:exopolysaccharide biosynthesis protein
MNVYKLATSLGLFCIAGACATLTDVSPSGPRDYVILSRDIVYRQIRSPAPNPRVSYVVRLDLSQGHLAMRLTRADTSGGKEFRSLTTSSFTRQTGAIIGVNGGFFGPVVDAEGVAMDAAGFVVADGVIASPALVPSQDSAVVKAVVCFAVERVIIEDAQACPSQYREGLAAGPRLLRDGTVAADPANVTRHPRTALGISARGDKVWLVVTDGRQAGYSEGATLVEMAELLKGLGAVNAINLDGGGSSALVYTDPQSGLRVLNRPIQSGSPGKERPVATHIGVFAVSGHAN